MPYKNKERKKERAREYYLENREKENARTKRWAASNREYKKQYDKEWIRTHPGRNTMATAKWRKKNPNYNKEWRSKNKESRAEKSKKYYESHKEHIFDYVLRTKYRITAERYRNMLMEQDGRCAICKKEPRGTGKEIRLHVDHDHKTGKVRGLLCSSCNIGLSKYMDSPQLLRQAADYLARADMD